MRGGAAQPEAPVLVDTGTAMGPHADAHHAQEDAAAPYTVVLYYKYVRVADCEAELRVFVAEHEAMCRALELTGRVRIALEGINGTLGGSHAHIAQYIDAMARTERFSGIDWKTSAAHVPPFSELLVRLAPEIVALELPDAQCDPTQGGTHLSPAQFHAAQQGDARDYALIDVRNTYEYNIGHFEGAINPNTRRFSQFPEWVRAELPALQQKDKILMYCTGGIRCEKASAYLRHLGLRNVYQLQGGIHRYLEQFPDGGRFQGKNFVFDQRVALASDDQTVAGRCEHCELPYDVVSGLRCQYCRTHVLLCDACRAATPAELVFCSDHVVLVRGSVEELEFKAAALDAQMAEARGHGKKGKRRSLRKQLDIVRARIHALSEQNGAEHRERSVEYRAAAC